MNSKERVNQLLLGLNSKQKLDKIEKSLTKLGMTIKYPLAWNGLKLNISSCHVFPKDYEGMTVLFDDFWSDSKIKQYRFLNFFQGQWDLTITPEYVSPPSNALMRNLKNSVIFVLIGQLRLSCLLSFRFLLENIS